MPDNVLEVLLEKIINNWRKVYGAILGFIVGLTVIRSEERRVGKECRSRSDLQ